MSKPIIIPKKAIPEHLAIETNSSNDWEIFVLDKDSSVLYSVVDMIRSFDMVAYFTRDIAANMHADMYSTSVDDLMDDVPKYAHISLAAVGENYKPLVDRLDSFRPDLSRFEPGAMKEVFGTRDIELNATSPELLGDVSPLRCYSFTWSAKAERVASGISQKPDLRELVLGVYKTI